jgi:SAM-dependent methyltransferase
MTHVTNQAPPTGQAAGRGERLYPFRSSRLYWHLTCLRREYEEVVRRFVEPLQRRETLVDFGCGNMPYRPLFEPLVGQYLGCDLSGNEAADRILDRPDGLPFPAGTVDVVLSSQVLEHCEEPSQYLSECARVLRPGGLLLLSTHGVWRYHPDPIDLWRWTSAGLKRTIEREGLRVVHFRGVFGPAATGLQIWQDAVLPRVKGSLLRTVFLRFMQYRIRVADQACEPAARDRDASVYVLVAEKIADVAPRA